MTQTNATQPILLPVGTEDFRRVIDQGLYFVDKSLLIKEIFDDRATDKIVITRPRRFGKTLNLSMLYHFLAEEVDGKLTKGLFDNLKIAQSGDTYMRHQGKFPVVSVSFKEIATTSYEEAISDVAKMFSTLYLSHEYLLSSSKLSETNKHNFEKVTKRTANISDLKSALIDLTHYLYKHHGVKPWLLIDEYDTPLQNAYSNQYYADMVAFMRSLMGAALKGNPNIEKAVLTGILRIAKESLFSGVNNLEVYSLLSDNYCEHFGFTEEEVADILKQTHLEDKAADIKAWYNGYQVGDTVIYNPISIAKCIKAKGQTRPYWVNTSDNTLIKDLLKESTLSFKQDFEILMHGGQVDEFIDENMVFRYLGNNVASVWSLLFEAGYLKASSVTETEQGVLCQLVIPNIEVRNLYRQIIEGWLANGQGIKWYNTFLKALLQGDIPIFKKHLDILIIQIASYHDFAKEPEAFYHGLLLGFTASLHSKGDYEIKSNREAGLGRFDIMLIPKDSNKLGIILELKAADNVQSIKSAAEKALQQIDEKKYITEMHVKGVLQSLKIGIGFCGKESELCFARE